MLSVDDGCAWSNCPAWHVRHLLNSAYELMGCAGHVLHGWALLGVTLYTVVVTAVWDQQLCAACMDLT